jgi:hypothetical protein
MKIIAECWDKQQTLSKKKVVKEGFKLKNYFLDPTGGNQAREAANTEKIIAKYPTAKHLQAALVRLQKDPACNDTCHDKFQDCIEKLNDPKYQQPAIYKEFVRKNLSGASGFWKYVGYGLMGGLLPWYKIYKVHRVEDQINGQDADQAMLAMNRRNMFR